MAFKLNFIYNLPSTNLVERQGAVKFFPNKSTLFFKKFPLPNILCIYILSYFTILAKQRNEFIFNERTYPVVDLLSMGGIVH